MTDPRTHLLELLEESQRLGFLGPGPVVFHVEHSLAFLPHIRGTRVLDLGSGGGVPGLVLATLGQLEHISLLDSRARRVSFLEQALAELGLDGEVLCGRAETLGRDPRLRQAFDTVVSRSFGPPAVTAECGSPFLVSGGRLVVSEPPDGGLDRWSRDGLARLGLADLGPVTTGMVHLRVLEQRTPCPDRYPRLVGRPAKAPLF